MGLGARGRPARTPSRTRGARRILGHRRTLVSRRTTACCQNRCMRVVVSGASGLIGPALVPALRADGHEVVKLVRRDPTSDDERRWDPASGTLDPAHIAGADAIVNLSGANLDQRWTDRAKREILESRTKTTGLLAAVAAELDSKPSAFVCAGGTGIYGNRGDEILTEESEAGGGFLAGVMRETEAAAGPARAAGIRVVNFRQGIVLSQDGGALKRMLPFFRFGLGGPVGSGASMVELGLARRRRLRVSGRCRWRRSRPRQPGGSESRDEPSVRKGARTRAPTPGRPARSELRGEASVRRKGGRSPPVRAARASRAAPRRWLRVFGADDRGRYRPGTRRLTSGTIATWCIS